MRWTPGGESDDIEDRRDEGGDGGFGFGGGFGGMHIGLGGMLLLLILSFVFKHNFFNLVSTGGGVRPAVSQPDRARDSREEPEVQFISFVLDDTQKTWSQILPSQGVALPPCQTGAVPRYYVVGMRNCPLGDRTVLLSGRREGLH